MNKGICEKCEENAKNKTFDPFCYNIGPPKDKRVIKQGGFLYRRTGMCWFALTGKIYWKEIGKDVNKEE